MSNSLSLSDVIARHDEVARDVLWQVRDAYEALTESRRDLDKELAKETAARLSRQGYLTMAGTKTILDQFQSALDMVAWKTSYALGVALVLDRPDGLGMATDRMQALDEFSPKMRLAYMPLLKVYVDLEGNCPFTRPMNMGEAYLWGIRGALTPTPVSAATPANAGATPDQPF